MIKAAILGAESFGFGTAPMIALGCKYLRICHLNNCATGVATQNDKLRKDHFIGTTAMVINFFTFIATETREWLARLGVRSLGELIGRTDLLEILPGETAKQQNLDLAPLLGSELIPADKPQFCEVEKNPPFDQGLLAEKMVELSKAAIEGLSGGSTSWTSATATDPSARGYPARSPACTATRAWPRHRWCSVSRAPRDRASACGTPVACTCTWKATPTTT